jgi:hypothetical protein
MDQTLQQLQQLQQKLNYTEMVFGRATIRQIAVEEQLQNQQAQITALRQQLDAVNAARKVPPLTPSGENIFEHPAGAPIHVVDAPVDDAEAPPAVKTELG